MKISEALEWDWFTGQEVDVDEFKGTVDVRKVDWDLAIWGTKDWAKVAREHKANKGSTSVIPLTWQQYLAVPGVFAGLISRIPYSELRVAHTLYVATEHIIKSMMPAASEEKALFSIYFADRGVWVHGGKEVNQALLRVLGTDFAEAMNRAADLVEHIASIVLTAPGRNASASDKAEYKSLMGKVDRIRKFEASLKTTGKHNTIRGFWKGLVVEEPTAWDSDMRWIVLKDCTLDLDSVMKSKGDVTRSATVPHSPSHMSTMSLDVAWSDYGHSDLTESAWYTGVAKALPDADVRRYLQKRYGAALLGKPGVVSKSMVWQYGPQGAAKSSIQEIIAGEEGVLAPYSYVSSATALTSDGQKNHDTERLKAYVRGKRLVLMDEISRGARLLESEVKTLTGGNTVEGTAKFANSVSYKFTATMFIASNDPPTVSSGDTITMNRIHVVPFNHQFIKEDDVTAEEWAALDPAHRADPEWQSHILESPSERMAVLLWVLDGLFLYAAEGLGELPAAIVEAQEEFREDGKGFVDRILDFMVTGGSAGDPWIQIYTDDEWASYGFKESDGLSTDRFRALLETAGHVSGLSDGRINSTTVNNVITNLSRSGGRKKRAKVGEKSIYVFSRVRENPVATGLYLSAAQVPSTV